jgi:tetratricopeptide (TPR) repeat protein
LKDFKGAISDFDRAITLNPNFAKSYDNRGITKYKLEDIAGAVTDWYKAAELYRQQGNTNDYQKVMKQVKDAIKAAEDAVHPQVDRAKLEAFSKELMHWAEEFHKEVQALTYHRSDGTEGLLCAGSGRGLEDRRLYIDQFIARNMYLLTPGSADYNTVINFQNSIKTTSDVEIHACDYLNKPSDQY